jgi:hypothetical protein
MDDVPVGVTGADRDVVTAQPRDHLAAGRSTPANWTSGSRGR